MCSGSSCGSCWQVADVEARHGDGLALDLLVDAGHDLEQRRLARAVQAEHADLGAGEEGQRDVVQDLPLGRHDLADAMHGEDVLSHIRDSGESMHRLAIVGRMQARRRPRRPPSSAARLSSPGRPSASPDRPIWRSRPSRSGYRSRVLSPPGSTPCPARLEATSASASAAVAAARSFAIAGSGVAAGAYSMNHATKVEVAGRLLGDGGRPARPRCGARSTRPARAACRPSCAAARRQGGRT